MKNPLCKELLISQPTSTEVEDFYSFYIVSCVLNIHFILPLKFKVALGFGLKGQSHELRMRHFLPLGALTQ